GGGGGGGGGGRWEDGEMRGLLRLSYQSLGVEPLESSNNTQNGYRPKVLSVPSQEFAIPIVKSKIQNPKALELADLVLAAASGELEGGDGISPATGRNFVALQTLQYIELLQEQECLPQTLALAYQTLGNFYRDRILAGDVSRTYLLIAIRAYEMVLEFTSSDAKLQGDRQEDGERKALINQLNQNLTQLSPGSNLLSTVPDILNDLGTLYWMLSRYPRSPEIASFALSDLEHSIALYQQALAQLNPKTQPQSYARLQKNLGATWGDLARFRDSAQNLQHSVRAYEEALLHIDSDVDPKQYAALENNLGTAYWNLAQHDRPVGHLESAIAAYTKALSYYSPEREPLNYAGVQNNLGTAWWNLAQHEPSEGFLLEAVDAYREALRYRTQELVPAACAATQNNLGTVYWHLANLRHKQGRIESLEKAIAAYQIAIAAAKQIHPNQLTFDILAAYNNLGLAHYQLATDPYFSLSKLELRSHLESALQNQLQACTGWQQQINGSGLTGLENTNSQTQTSNPIYADCRQTALNCIVKTIRAFYSECGLQGQNFALSKLPSDLLPEILQQL
ncbi:tetratricopeptide repeat protein, partial [Kamptonema sp. UHCC 0994]|uniref:tetratricopeptide repeat protein n=1 Tax=Kamptonema sp. UHCC 0994 TaxID=3031329 RepID=UPI0023B99008